MKARLRFWFLGCAFVTATHLPTKAQTPPPPAKRLPPAGIAISAKDRAELTAGAAALRKEIDALARELEGNALLLTLLPDVEIFHKAVDWALRYDEFFAAKEIAAARKSLAQGRERIAQLRAGHAPWLEATGLVVRGYRSKLDNSIQPFGLFVPAGLGPGEHRLEVWLLGRGEKRTELAFLTERQAGPPQLVPRDTICLVPYGRYCNATKFAGEVDVFEGMEAAMANCRIDANRISVAGFSMGGASTWHLAAHYASLWCSASPGAGFAETPIYTKAFAPGKEPPTWWEQKLYHWYNATDYAANLFNCPTIAYSGEIDPQKESADLMEKAMAAEGLELERFIGPKTAHKYEPATKEKLFARLDEVNAKGRPPRPREVRVTTYTPRYPGTRELAIFALEKSWERADARLQTSDKDHAMVETKNVRELHLYFSPSHLTIDGQTLSETMSSEPARSLLKTNGRWAYGSLQQDGALHKRIDSVGPIDDAFMSRFVFVRPTGKPLNETLGNWSKGELAHATKMWRDIFRGDAPTKDDSGIGDEDIAQANLVLWGDPSSNRLLARILATGKLPLAWDAHKIVFRGKTYDAAHHAPIFIFPNPLNPARYVVLNSGIDFREHAYGTNALQIPKLPDYAIVDIGVPPDSRWPGKIVDAGFFDENWR